MPAEGQNKEKRTLCSRYRVEKRLGSGNFGTAYLVTDTKEKNELKVMKQIPIGELLPDETVDAMSEARLLSRLKHPNIVKFHDSFLDGESFCIVTEFCEGGDLDQKVQQAKKEKKTFDEKQVMDWFTQLLLAVQYMHKRRVLHRDLKARNIFLKSNMVKIGDFGISKILMGTSDMASTFTGTPYYMSPEVLKHEGYNSKSDVWSIGCILYELCHLEHAFEGKGLMGVMFKVVEGDLPQLPSRYSPELNEILQIIFERDVNKRPDAFELTQHPFIADHIQRMTAELSGEDLPSPDMTIAATSDSAQLAKLLSTKTHLGDLQREEEERYRGLTARERLRLKKQQEADSKGRALNEAAKQNLAENQMRKTMLVRERTTVGAAPWVHGMRQPDEDSGTTTSRAFGTSTSRASGATPSRTTYQQQLFATMPPRRSQVMDDDDDDDDNDDDDGGTVLQTVKVHRDYKPPAPPLQRLQHRASVGDDRPITPLRNKMVYEKHSSLDFPGGVPDDPSLANTYYSQFESEFEEDDEAAAQTVIRKPPPQQNGGNRVIAQAMQKVLSEGPQSTLRDDMVAGAFGPHAKQLKMENMRAKSIQVLGEDKFREVYDYVKHARLEKREEDQIIAGVKQLDANPDGCFYVDQLLFLEMN